MAAYIQIIHASLDYIEEHLSAPIRVADLSRHVYLSEFHFNRLFKAAVGISPKQYILGRKLTLAQDRLRNSRDSLITIAYDLGFEYPEVFSRAFKKQYGLSPRCYRTQQPALPTLPRAEVVARDWMNFQGTLVVKAEFVELPELDLRGLWSAVDLQQPGYADALRAAGDRFASACIQAGGRIPERFYNVVTGQGREDECYDVLIGCQDPALSGGPGFSPRTVPGGWYARFDYRGDMLDIRANFVDDLFRWILVKDVRLDLNGVGMLTEYDQTYFTEQAVKIFVPVVLEGDPLQQKTS